MSSSIPPAPLPYFFLYGAPAADVSACLTGSHRSPGLCSFSFVIIFTFCSSDWISTYLKIDLTSIMLTVSVLKFTGSFSCQLEPFW